MRTKRFCNECGGDNLSWRAQVVNLGGCEDGSIKLNETDVLFALGCKTCSATIRTMTGEKVATWINNQPHQRLFNLK